MKNKLPFYILIFLFTFLFAKSSPVLAAANVYLSPSITQTTLNGSVTFSLRVNTNGEAANAFDVTVQGTENAQITGANKSGSICSLWIQEPSAQNNSARFTCGLPNPGFNGTGTIGNVVVRGTALGTHTINVTSAQVLANDGSGSNITGSTSNAQLKVNPPVAQLPTITSSSHPDQNSWYSLREVSIQWSALNATGVSYEISQSEDTVPDTTVDTTEGSFSVTSTSDGIWYIHVRAKSGNEWSGTAHFKIQVDTEGPENLVITSDPGGIVTIIPNILFNAQDETSTIARYEMSFNNGEWIEVTSPYRPNLAQSGDNIVKVRAYDAAGNMIENGYVSEIDGPEPPKITTPKNGALVGINQPILISGKAAPNSKIQLFIRNELIAEVTSDSEGNFEYSYQKLLAPENYALTAKVIENNIISEPSDIIRFDVSANLIQIGPWVFQSTTLIYTLLLLAILLLILVLLLLLKKKRDRDQEEVIHQEINKFVKNDMGIVRRLLYRLYSGSYQKKQEVSDSVSTISNKLEKIERVVKDSLDSDTEKPA